MSSKFELLGVRVNAVTIEELNLSVKEIIENNRKEILANHNLHSIYLINKYEDLREFWELSYITHVDGMPLIWWGKILNHPLERKHRVTYLDWIHPLLNMANQNKWKIFYLGGKPGVANRAANILSDKYENIHFKTHTGYFNADKNSSENKKIIEVINLFKPNILMVGMGMPRQERWILENIKYLKVNAILNSGACFDYIAGEQKSPPRYLGKLGFEWFYRLILDPIRLYKRYLVEPISLIPYMLTDIKEKIKE